MYLRTGKRHDLMHYPSDALIEGYFNRLLAERAVGLAAPQIDQPLNFAVIAYHGLRLVLVNPVVKGFPRRGKKLLPEGCLSLPGKQYMVMRDNSLRLYTLGPDDVPIVVAADGYLARIVQHEMDHLRGVLISDVGTEVVVESA